MRVVTLRDTILQKYLVEKKLLSLFTMGGVFIHTAESRFLEPPDETQFSSRNREFEKSKVASNYA